MNWSEFYQSVDAGDIAPVYLFTGPEEYVKLEAMAKLREKLLPPGLEALNDAVLEGVTAQQITDAERIEKADVVFNNDGTKEELYNQVVNWWHEYNGI